MNTPDFEKAAEWLEACADRILGIEPEPKPRLIATIEGCQIVTDERKVWWTAKAAIDDDGSENRWRDPDWQSQTTLQYKGKPIDSERIPGIVVPPAIVQGVRPIVFGCQAAVTFNGRTELAVVFDLGPRSKVGEITPELARRTSRAHQRPLPSPRRQPILRVRSHRHDRPAPEATATSQVLQVMA